MLLFVPVKLCFSMTGTRLGRENRFSIFDHFWQVTSERWHCRPRNLFRIGGYKDDNLCRVVVSRNGSKPTSYFGQGRCGKEYMSGDAVLRRQTTIYVSYGIFFCDDASVNACLSMRQSSVLLALYLLQTDIRYSKYSSLHLFSFQPKLPAGVFLQLWSVDVNVIFGNLSSVA